MFNFFDKKKRRSEKCIKIINYWYKEIVIDRKYIDITSKKDAFRSMRLIADLKKLECYDLDFRNYDESAYICYIAKLEAIKNTFIG